MAKYDVPHLCGHRVEHQLFGAEKDRQSRIAWLKTRPCRDCLREIETEQAEADQERDGLPELIGSPKQVAWALTIRAKTLALIDRYLAARDVDLDQRVPVPESVRFGDDETVSPHELLDHLRAKDAAKWWIDICKDVDKAGRPVRLGALVTELGMLTETDFVGEVLRATLGIAPPTITDLANSDDVRLMMRAVVTGR